MIKWIRTSRLSTKNSLSLAGQVLVEQTWYMLETLIGLTWESETQQEEIFFNLSNLHHTRPLSGAR